MSKENGKLYKTKKPLLQYVLPSGEVISFGKRKRYRTKDEEEIAFLDAEANGKYPQHWVAEDQDESDEEPMAPGTNMELRAQQLREFLATSSKGAGDPVVAQDSAHKSPIKPASTEDSPLTGGVAVPSTRYTQQETIAALRSAKIKQDNK